MSMSSQGELFGGGREELPELGLGEGRETVGR